MIPHQMNQLAFFKQPAPAQTQQEPRLSPELLAKIRRSSEEFLLAVNYVNDVKYERLLDVPTEAMKAARAFISPKRYENKLMTVAAASPVLTYKPYRRTSEVSRRRRRVTLLLNRIRKQEPLFFFERVQAKLVSNPEYYGVCVLGSDGICSINPSQRLRWRKTERAIARENELRRYGE